MSNDRLKYLFEQYIADASTPEEVRELIFWVSKPGHDELLKEKINELWRHSDTAHNLPDVDWDEIYSRIVRPNNTPVIQIWKQVAVAVVIVGFLFGTLYFFISNPKENLIIENRTIVENDIMPPNINKATITLSDGSIVYLDSTDNGEVAQQGNVRIVKQSSGQIGYEQMNLYNHSSKVELNTLTNPKGSQIIQMNLSDGSRIWLNSGSSITYPIIFSGNERRVQVDGEVYFEVSKNKQKPFYVSKGLMQVQVLGTHFNVSAYEDEPEIRVTLIEGAVKVNYDGKEGKVLGHGQQAQIGIDSKIVVHNKINMDAVTAWMNGRFIFDGDNIQSVMRQLARWYNVEVNYQGHVTNEKFVGIMNRSRYHGISSVLDMFEKTRIVSFDINGRQIIVKPFKD